MIKRWVLKKEGNPEHVKHLSKELNLDKCLANLLAQRGIASFNEAKAFFRPQLSALHDPFLMKDMDKAIARIDKAINNKEKILIYGDYDVDGTTAVALVYTFIRKYYKKVDFYIPDRYSEGYGISYQSIDFAEENESKLVIALDCGIKAVEKIEYANKKGIDYIIADHHRPGDTLPNAQAVLDAKRPDCEYPYKELSGCGVGFKLIQAYAQKNNIPFEKLHQYLDLVAISIASDIVPITGENRILAYYGLKLINNKPRAGVEAILQYSNISRKKEGVTKEKPYILNKELSISDLVFLVGPRINAAGRMESGRDSVRLLISDRGSYATKLAQQINDYNTERRNLDAQITQEALNMIASSEDQLSAKSTIVYNANWHKGVIGIVASRLTDIYYRPTIVMTESNGLITGSARSIKDFDIYDAIDECSDLLEHFGGHKYAAGLSLKKENLEEFSRRFETIAQRTISANDMIPEIEIDMNINLNQINSKFLRILNQFAPFGPGNMAPIFQTDNIVDTGKARIVGKNHIKMTLIHPDISAFPIPAIAFQLGQHITNIEKGERFSVTYYIEENEWNNQRFIQLNIKDIKFNTIDIALQETSMNETLDEKD